MSAPEVSFRTLASGSAFDEPCTIDVVLTENGTSALPSLTAMELRRLPSAERDAILAAAAAIAEHEYTSNPALTDFEAFGEEDLHGESSDSEKLPG